MGAITGESLFYDVSRILGDNQRVSYYQYRALSSFTELVVLHDNVALLVGDETDNSFVRAFDWLINALHEKSDFKVDFVTPKNRNEYITLPGLKQFDLICREIYPYPLGITSDQLFIKQPKNRIAEDMSDRIERMFCEKYPEFNGKRFAESLYSLWLSNANSPELMYFFRAHLLQGIAEVRSLTPIFENQKLIAAVLHHKNRIHNKVGTLPYTIYKMVDSLFTTACQLLHDGKSLYPRPSLFICALIRSVNKREELLDAIIKLRTELRDFRSSYKELEEKWDNDNASLLDRAEVSHQVEESVNKVWIPTIKSLGRNHASSAVSSVVKKVFGKYGIGDVTLERESKLNSTQDSFTYTTPSLIGVGAALAQTISEVHKDAKLARPNKTLLEVINNVVRLTDLKDKLAAVLPVYNFEYRTYKLLDSLSAANTSEVTK